MQNSKLKIYTVSRLSSLIKVTLEEHLPSRLVVTGQVSDWRRHQSGHCYFSLRDEDAVLPCVIWASDFRKVKFEPENGLAVLATGFIDVYVPHGRYQFMVDKLEPAGVGALQIAFEQMVRRLEAEGLFDQAHKKPLPKYPNRIGILTSESGDAVKDIVRSIFDRWPCAKLFLYPVPVQGEGAAEKIAEALKDINRRNKELKLNVLIVGRGGGSLEDLWAFNEEVLARAIYNSKIPVISAVGHEADITIADLVADARASTPTKAGVIAVPDRHEVLEQLANMQSRLTSKMWSSLELAQKNLETILAGAAFKNPLLPVRNRHQQLDEISGKLTDAVRRLLTQARNKLHTVYDSIIGIEPHRLLGKKKVDLSNFHNRANTAVTATVNRLRLQLTASENRLAALNPKSVLQRGYSITTNKKTSLLIRFLDDVQVDDSLITELAGENLIESKVVKKQNRVDPEPERFRAGTNQGS
jgi:exodeoxyribonuclease VII large subunit